MHPTITRIGAVAALGIAETNGESTALRRKQTATTIEVSPVRPPAAMPAADSIYVVVLDVPISAPIDVAVESANRALSILELKPLPFSIASSSACEKIPDRRPVPMKVPIVSKVSDRENAKIVTRTRGIFAGLLNRAGNP